MRSITLHAPVQRTTNVDPQDIPTVSILARLSPTCILVSKQQGPVVQNFVSLTTPGKRSICTPKAYNYEII